MSQVDWLGTPLEGFLSRLEKKEDGTFVHRTYPLGESEACHLMVGLSSLVEETYWKLLLPEDIDRVETTGEVPIIRNSQRTYENLASLTLRDLPTILATFVVLEEELTQWERDESERRAAERREVDRIRARERRKLKKLGEW